MTDFPDTLPPLTLTSSAETARSYAALTQDWNPIHLDPEFAAKAGFERPIVHGTMALNLLVEAVEKGSGGALRIADLDIRFAAPTWIGQALTTQATREGGETYAVSVTADDGRVVMRGNARLAPRNPDQRKPTE